ncbi:hypothetical protein DFH06DRAFT_1308681 [Mycena polygramma]|nr:hypothetical protein DFH06DRAFT_1308681 [Mycena polygramma]
MASNEETVESLSYLSRYIDDSRKRILALEQELESTSTTFSNDIRRLEAEKARIHGEIATLRDTLKVKQERSSDLAQVKLENETLGRELAAVQEKLKHVEHSGDASQFVEQRIALRQQITSFQEALKMKTARCLDIPRLEAENASLRKEIVSLQDALKVKKEPTSNPLDALADAPGSVPSEMQLKLIEDEREALQIKCTSLYAQVKQSAGLAAKALRERVEGLKELGKMRAEAENLTGELDRVKHMYDEVTAANDAGSAERAALVEANDASKADINAGIGNDHTPRGESYVAQGLFQLSIDLWLIKQFQTCETLTEQVTSSSAALAKVKMKYKEVKKEKLALQEVSPPFFSLPWMTEEEDYFRRAELIELVERMEEEAKTDTVPVNSNKKKKADDHPEQDDDMSEYEENPLAQEPERETGSAQVTAVPRETYRQYMKALPSPQGSSGTPPSKPRPVFTGRRELKLYLDTAGSSSHPFLCLMKRTMPTPWGHYLAFAPTHRYDHKASVWVKDCDFESCYGALRELFIDQKSQLFYMGTFKCIEFGALNLRKTPRIDKNLIRDLALSGTRPLDSEMMIQQQYPSGTIEIERMALQFVGFNHELYNTLRDDYCRRRTECRKRRAENAPEGNKRGPPKRQKV